jgi:DNA-binding transcriptional regulator YiaG
VESPYDKTLTHTKEVVNKVANYVFNNNKIVRLRKTTGLSRYKFARLVNSSSHVIKGWEEGTSLPSIPTLIVICKKFDLDITKLFLRR